MQQAVFAGCDLDERAVVLDAPNDALVLVANLRLHREALDDFDGLAKRFGIGGGDAHGAIVGDVDLGSRLIGNRFDHLAAGPDDHANLIGFDLERLDARRVLGELRAWSWHDFVHLAQDVQAPFARLLQRFAHDLLAQTSDLDVHLDGGDAVGRATDLEVHVTEMILVAEDVGQDGILFALHDEAHRHTRDRRLDGNAGIHHRQASPAHRGHRRRSIRLGDLGDDAHRVRKVLVRGQDLREGALRQIAVSDLAATRATKKFRFANRVGWEIVVENERLVVLVDQAVDLLLVLPCPERCRHDPLCLSTREKRRAVNSR